MSRQITKIEIQKNNSDRVNIFIDDEFSFSCSLELVYKYKLERGKQVKQEELFKLEENEKYLNCKKDALKCIERTNKSEKELIDKLLSKGHDENIIYKVIEFMKNYNFVNDEKFTESYIKDKMKQSGSNKIKYSLIQKGISEELIQDKLNELLCDNEKLFALELGKKKLNSLTKSESDERKIYKKLSDYLLRKGYKWEEVKEIVKELLNESR